MPAARSPVVRRATGRVQSDGLLRNVLTTAHRLHSGRCAVGLELDVVPVLCVDVFSVKGVVDDAALAVVLGVEEVLLGVFALVYIVAPGVEEGAGGGVDVDEVFDVGEDVVHPGHVAGLRLGEGRGAVEGLR